MAGSWALPSLAPVFLLLSLPILVLVLHGNGHSGGIQRNGAICGVSLARICGDDARSPKSKNRNGLKSR